MFRLMLAWSFLAAQSWTLDIVVPTSKGPVRGRLARYSGQAYAVFLGIPYAEPPVNELRFKSPKPLQKTWSLTLDAVSHAPMCPQKPLDFTTMNEDCLYLNVYSPAVKAETQEKVPVLFWIHGGSFKDGSALHYPEEGIIRNIVHRGVVVVTMNYRLGILGYWTTKSGTSPGNYALLDQLMALQWVKDEISNFGGDPDKVTVAGESAGAASASFLALSPLSRDLFKRAILMSGSGFATWAINRDWEMPDASYELASNLGCLRGGNYEPMDQKKTGPDTLPYAEFQNSGERPSIPQKLKKLPNAKMIEQEGSWLGLLSRMEKIASGWVGGTDKAEKIPVENETHRSPFDLKFHIPSPPYEWLTSMNRFEQRTFFSQRGMTSHESILHCMQKVPVEDLFMAMNMTESGFDLAFAPRYDNHLLPYDIDLLIKEGMPKEIIIGTNRDETAYIQLFLSLLGYQTAKTKNDVLSAIDLSYTRKKLFNVDFLKKAAAYKYAEIPDFMVNSLSVSSEDLERYWFEKVIQMGSAISFFVPAYKEAASWVDQGSKVYLYSFDYSSPAKDYPFAFKWAGAIHSSILEYLFDFDYMRDPYGLVWSYLSHNVTEPDIAMRTMMGTFCTSFVKFGDPTPLARNQTAVWEPLSLEEGNYLSIAGERSGMKKGYHADDIHFWTQMVEPMESLSCSNSRV